MPFADLLKCKKNALVARIAHSSLSKRQVIPTKESGFFVSLIHGDEHASGTVATQWIRRLCQISILATHGELFPLPIPMGGLEVLELMPGVDVNRNFPSEDWERLAQMVGKKKIKILVAIRDQRPQVNPKRDVF